ncbi:uncharacterized protein TRUGW13939_04157 [Talaromyces rugulosus]|uniref:Zn(2)-C6 fungal-type domain-containing protein n=1 Tax=Talaromyces rugulosus TaxID=121627 RepID=A0A7H8QSZ9_TALRU|nr:uncharacterized protein TRUGW13939_04157 [Talaromyces rugulosus]QKX57049.1 hypothetical protein TRUGW13939_04157 [Talaromyces rugulosus]
MSNPTNQGNHPPHSWSGDNNGNPPQPHWNPEDSNRPPSARPQSTYSHSNYPSYPPSHPSSYPPPSYPPSGYPQQPPPPPGMAAVHSSVQGAQDPYNRLPPPPPGPYPRPDMYAQPPPQVVYQAAAPRQRTAIACRYCRRRKIRCSGFESSPDGRCTNCVRFNQECMFTPVSSQAQAFVPAHAAYPHLRNSGPQPRGRGYPGDGVMLYGAHGQPLPPQQQPMSDSTLPPPQGAYYQPGPYGRPHLDERAPPPSLPPHHMPHDQRQQGGRRGSGGGFDYPEPVNLAPVSSGAAVPGYASTSYYHPPGHERRPSPQSFAGSPHSAGFPPIPAHGTPPPASTPSAPRGGLNVRDILNNPTDQSNGGRSSTDSDMLNQLNRKV